MDSLKDKASEAAQSDGGLSALVAALERCGIDKIAAQEAAGRIERDKVDLLYWSEADKQRIVLHVFNLARAKALLGQALAACPSPADEALIAQFVAGIDEHVSVHGWPADIDEDDPALLAALWQQRRIGLAAAGPLAGEPGRTALFSRLSSEDHRLLRSLLQLPITASPPELVVPVTDEDLAAALLSETNRYARAVAEEELHARHPAAYGFLCAVFGRRKTARAHRLLDLRRISSGGFGQSLVQSASGLAELTDNLTVASNALGPEQFRRITAAWDTLDKIRQIAVADLHPPGITIGGYYLSYPVEYSAADMPTWIEMSAAGELSSERSSDAGVYVFLTDHGRTGSLEDGAKSRLHQQYLDFQNDLIKPNYDALQLIVAHADAMTKLTAQTIISLLHQMVDAYQQIATRAEGDAAMSRYKTLLEALDCDWKDLSHNDDLAPTLRHRITSIEAPSPTGGDTAHSLIRFLHEQGNKALERLMTAARADMGLTVGRIGGDGTEEIKLARLDEAPIIARGMIRHRTVAAIVSAARWLSAPVTGTCVLVGNHLSYSVRLGEHRAELSANIVAPDKEGFIRLRSFQGGIELAQRLRSMFIRHVLAGLGLTVSSEQVGLVDEIVIGLLDKDHGARSDTQVEKALIMVLRLLWTLRDLDYAMAFLFAKEVAAAARTDKTETEQIDAFAASLARIFLVEGRIPFSYRGQGMPLDTYWEYTGPRMRGAYLAYLGEEQRMVRYRLYFTLNALSRKFALPAIPRGIDSLGQWVIDDCFNEPVREALGRGELRIDGRGYLERNPDYQPLKQIIGAVIAHENDTLRTALVLNKSSVNLAFRVIGGIDQLTVLCAQLEVAPHEWLVVYGLAEEENRTVLYAFVHHLASRGEGQWLSVAALRRALRGAGYFVPGTMRIPAFRKLVSHRLLVERPRARSKLMGTSVRGLLASVGDGSVRVGRITFDRAYRPDSQTRSRRVLLVPFTTPEDIEAVRAAEAVLVTSGGLLSHAGVTTRELNIPSLILPHAEWMQSPEGTSVRIEDRYPGRIHSTEEGFWISESMVSETITLREGDVVLVWASQSIVSTIPLPARLADQAQALMLGIASGRSAAADLEHWLAQLPCPADAAPAAQPLVGDALAFVLAEALWDRHLDSGARGQLMNVVQQARVGLRPAGAHANFPGKTAAHVNALVQTLLENAFTDSEQVLSEVEQAISLVTVYWRAASILATVERLWLQVSALADSLGLCDERMKLLEERIERLRRHPRVALLRTSALDGVASFSGRSLSEAELPAIRKMLRRLRHSVSECRPQTVVLVCTANIDRSPMAEFLLKKMLQDQRIDGIDVFSRGVAAAELRPMSQIGQALLLAEEGIDAATHHSRRIGEADLRGADLILAMERAHVEQLVSVCPDAADRMFLLSHYGGVPELGDIEDPVGQVGDAYPRMKRSLQTALSGTLKRMTEEGILAKAMTAHLQARADELTRAKRMRIAASGRTVMPLEEVDADSVELVGGKGANLGEIAQIVRRHGAQVPPALMVTTIAFERFLDENGLRDSFARMNAKLDGLHLEGGLADDDLHDEIVGVSQAIRDLILQSNLDAATGVGREITQAVEAYHFRNICLSVRSSGLQEDTEEAAFAGAAETFLCVRPAQLLHRIKSVWSSFWLTRGILYRSSRIARQAPVKPAVIIQQMFESQVSGVMFTTDPVSGKDMIVVEAGYGLGEGVVSGLVDVDRYYVDKSDGSVTGMHVGKKAFMVKQHPSGEGTSVVPVENDLRDVPCLKKRDIRPNIALAIEEHYALSQDIEFAIADGKFCVLQTRPVTTR